MYFETTEMFVSIFSLHLGRVIPSLIEEKNGLKEIEKNKKGKKVGCRSKAQTESTFQGRLGKGELAAT